MMKELMVCVQVDCKCPFSPDWHYYPKDIVGIHRIKIDDPRAKLGEQWTTKGEYCHGALYSQNCENESCNPFGTVVNILSECEGCSFKNDVNQCPLFTNK